MSPIPADYVDVAERIRDFKAEYPEGTLQSFMSPRLEQVGDKFFIVYSAAAYRTPDDPRPGVGWAWEPVPGPTPFTKDSELQNAETSAWGRAIVALGFETKKIASADEVRNRQPSQDSPPDHATAAEPFPTSVPETLPRQASKGQIGELTELLEHLELQEAKRNPTWRQLARRYVEEQFGVGEGENVNFAQMERVLEYMRPFLKEQKVTA